MAGVSKRLTKAVTALAASGVVQKAVRTAASDPRVQRKAAELEKALRKRAKVVGKAAGKKVGVAGKSARAGAAAMAKAAGKRVTSSVVTPARKAAGKKLQRLGKRVAV
jgi:hypothetical protein